MSSRKGKLLCAFLGIGLLAACGSNQENTTGSTSDKQTNPQTQENSKPSGRYEGNFKVGDVYDDGEFKAEYLGLAELSLGDYSGWSDGKCYAFLTAATYYNDPSQSGSKDTFNPSTKGVFNDGREAERDATGVDCNTKPLTELGYIRTHKAKLSVGESANIFTGAFHVPAADQGLLKGVVLFDGDNLFEPAVTVEAMAESQ